MALLSQTFKCAPYFGGEVYGTQPKEEVGVVDSNNQQVQEGDDAVGSDNQAQEEGDAMEPTGPSPIECIELAKEFLSEK